MFKIKISKYSQFQQHQSMIACIWLIPRCWFFVSFKYFCFKKWCKKEVPSPSDNKHWKVKLYYILLRNMLTIQKHRVLALTYIEICEIRLPKSLGVLELWGKGLVLIVARDWIFEVVVLVALVVIVVVGIGVEDSSTVSVLPITLSIMQFSQDGILQVISPMIMSL